MSPRFVSNVVALSANRPLRIFIIVAIATAMMLAAFVGLAVWSTKRLAEGVEQDSWLASGAPEMLRRFPVFEPCGEIIVSYEPRDGERAPANAVSYTSSLPSAGLIARYSRAMIKQGCTVKPGAVEHSIGLDCPGEHAFDLGITVTSTSTCQKVEAFWWGGEG